jgi:hypothetical protein
MAPRYGFLFHLKKFQLKEKRVHYFFDLGSGTSVGESAVYRCGG